jgi:hypothetical protein
MNSRAVKIEWSAKARFVLQATIEDRNDSKVA